MPDTAMTDAMPPITGLNHFAWRCRDAEETRHFYEDILGLPLAHTIELDYVPSTGEFAPYMHLFFRMGNGSYIAFFDLADGKGYTPHPDNPKWVNHFAFEVATYEEVLTAKIRLEENDIEVIGPTDHGFIRSIYFFDPNNLRLEITCRMEGPAEAKKYADRAHDHLKEWLAAHPKTTA
jgi:catechol 2,3-dioxygenase-like lactoylglutathione lyase family enzyme